MGLLDSLFRKAKAPRQPVVTVAFRELDARDPLANFSPPYGYAYIWPFPEPPQVGDWAVAPGIDGPATVIVGSLEVYESARGLPLKSLLRRISPQEVAHAQAERIRAVERWLDHARAVVDGSHIKTSKKQPPPPGFTPLPPVRGRANPQVASEHGSGWWRIYSTAEEFGRPPEEVMAFKEMAQRWYKVRDLGRKEERDRRIAETLASIDLGAAIRNVSRRPRNEVEAFTFAGQPLGDWLPHIQELEKSGQTEAALNLVYALITAAEQEARLSGREPAPAYTERAAIIHRKHRDYAAEIAVIERWDQACPPERRGPGATQAKLLKRLERARELASKATTN